MKFRTELQVAKAPFELNHSSTIVMQGSCFAENLGHKHQHYGFKTHLNSHGILFNPISICSAIDDAIEAKKYTPADLIQHNEKWLSMHHHGKFNSEKQEQVLEDINASILQAHDALKQAQILVITLGSAWAWVYKTNGQIVANCHKIPQAEFEKTLIHSAQIIEQLQLTINKLSNFNPALQIVLTVSPVRYLRDGLVHNNLSKAHLLTAVHQICEHSNNCHYFPAYELVIDDLRDYRFFKEDMLHPNQQAVDYVWEKWKQWSFSPSTLAKLTEMEPLLQLIAHRPMGGPNNEASNKVIEAKKQLDTIISR
jgi:hypothetical protein